MNQQRKVFKNSTASQSAVRDVLALIFAHELLAPSADVFIVAPWISNIVVFDNRLGQVSTINPEWAKSEIRLIEVVVALASNGTRVQIHTRPEAHNKQFEWRVLEAVSDAGVSNRFAWKAHRLLHAKGLLTDRVFVDGSMNLTESGVAINDEIVTISYGRADVASARVHFDSYEHG